MSTIIYVVDVNGDVVGQSTRKVEAMSIARKAMRNIAQVLSSKGHISINVYQMKDGQEVM